MLMLKRRKSLLRQDKSTDQSTRRTHRKMEVEHAKNSKRIGEFCWCHKFFPGYPRDTSVECKIGYLRTGAKRGHVDAAR